MWLTFITRALSKELLSHVWVLRSKIEMGRLSPPRLVSGNTFTGTVHWAVNGNKRKVPFAWALQGDPECRALGRRVAGFSSAKKHLFMCFFQLKGNGLLREEVTILSPYVLVDGYRAAT